MPTAYHQHRETKEGPTTQYQTQRKQTSKNGVEAVTNNTEIKGRKSHPPTTHTVKERARRITTHHQHGERKGRKAHHSPPTQRET